MEVDVSPEILDRYVGTYIVTGTPTRVAFTREGQTLFFKPGGESTGVPIEATAENRFKIDPFVFLEFDIEFPFRKWQGPDDAGKLLQRFRNLANSPK